MGKKCDDCVRLLGEAIETVKDGQIDAIRLRKGGVLTEIDTTEGIIKDMRKRRCIESTKLNKFERALDEVRKTVKKGKYAMASRSLGDLATKIRMEHENISELCQKE